MILAHIQDSARYESLHPLFQKAFDYIKANDLSTVPAGRIVLDGDNLFINVVDAEMVSADVQKLEAHRQYIDIHVPLLQTELIGYKHLSFLGDSDAPFDEAGDCALYTDSQVCWQQVRVGEFLLVYPEDAHAPLVGQGKQRKLIIKVRI